MEILPLQVMSDMKNKVSLLYKYKFSLKKLMIYIGMHGHLNKIWSIIYHSCLVEKIRLFYAIVSEILPFWWKLGIQSWIRHIACQFRGWKHCNILPVNEFNIHFNLNTHLLKTTKYQLTYINMHVWCSHVISQLLNTAKHPKPKVCNAFHWNFNIL
jgi:hypothetical protein